jgi:hypothetical protein
LRKGIEKKADKKSNSAMTSWSEHVECVRFIFQTALDEGALTHDGGLKVVPASGITPALRELIRDCKAALVD